MAKKSSNRPPGATKKTAAAKNKSGTASKRGDWRDATLQRAREIILKSDPEIVEEIKWRKPSNPAGVPVWSRGGIICTGETYKDKVKLTFAKGAELEDPAGLFNASLEGKTRRAIDIVEGQKINAAALTRLIREAVALNTGGAKQRTAAKLLSGGNPQIAKGYGDAPVQEYIAAMPGWKRAVGQRMDALIERAVPGVYKAVKWNSPFYGIEGEGWFLSYHCFAKYIKVTFFQGASLQPAPTEKSRYPQVRYFHIHEHDVLDEARFSDWVKQASRLPGEKL
jgi:hypothetical protein